MKRSRSERTNRRFEAAIAAGKGEKCVLRLYVAGASARSREALLRVRQLCEQELREGRCDLEVIDVYQQPILARDGQIIATPTLVKKFPKPVRRLIGNLQNTRRLIVGVDYATGRSKNGR